MVHESLYVSHVLLLPHTGGAAHVSTFLDVLASYVFACAACSVWMLSLRDAASVSAFTVHAAFQPNMPSL